MSTGRTRAGGTTSATNATATTAAASVPDNPPRPRKSKWLQDDGHLIGIARRKGEKNPMKWNVELDPQYARFAPKDWSPVLLPLTEKKKKKKKPPSTNSTVSGSSKKGKGGGMMQKLMFWKKKDKGKEVSSSGSRGRSTAQGASKSGARSGSGSSSP